MCGGRWEAEKVFETDPAPAKEKYFVTFPYPYMNGRLHLGHAFTVTKADFTAAYQRLKGKQVLFPFAFHCTGMPIQAAALKLRRELDEGIGKNDDDAPEPATATAAAPPTTFASKKTKTVRKTGTAKTQYEIMLMSGIPEEEIPRFRDTQHWLDYFPPLGETDLRAFGLHCDWRRSFITTSANPYYDSFVQWQFRTLYARGKLMRGKRPTICTPDDGQACADHDRQSGEGVKPQEYTLIKLRVAAPTPALASAMAKLPAGAAVFLVAATLRPETMYGQTNVYVLPTGTYGLYEVGPGEVFVCGEHAARNMAFQGMPGEQGEERCVGKLLGSELILTLVDAPLSKYEKVYVLPMSTVSMTMGTAVVTSVPSDSPDDFMSYNALKTKPDSPDCKQFGIEPKHVAFPPDYPIIAIEGYDGPAAPLVCARMKIKSPKDAELLAQAKAEVYLAGFEKGVMLVGEWKGLPVKEAKTKVRDWLVARGLACMYSEPASAVVSRTGLPCVVKNLDQWYLPYGEDAWESLVREHVETRFNAYTPTALKSFQQTLLWLREWACSRSFGLGTALPAFTERDRAGEFVIESLSDSTIYMAY